MQGALRYRLSQFTRRVRTDLACLGGGLDTLDSLAAVLGDSIDRGAAGEERDRRTDGSNNWTAAHY